MPVRRLHVDECWLEEELMPTEATVAKVVNTMKGATERQVRAAAKGIMRVDQPRWRRLTESKQSLRTDRPGTLYLVRLGFQFDFVEAKADSRLGFVYARCWAYLWPSNSGAPVPTVYDLWPKNLYEGEPRVIQLEFEPSLRVEKAVEASAGRISTKIEIGQVAPVVVGWPGEEERAPHWELRPRTKPLLGVRHFWLVVERPPDCTGIRFAVLAEGDIETRFGPIAVGPKERVWEARPSIVIG